MSDEVIDNYRLGDSNYQLRASDSGSGRLSYRVIDVGRNLDLTADEPFTSRPLDADVLALAEANELAWATDEA